MKKAVRVLSKAPETVAGILLVIIIALNLLCVVMRYFVRDPITWGEEVTLLLYAWLVFVGIAAVEKRFTSTAIDVLSSRFPMPVQRVMVMVITGVQIVIYAMLIYYVIQLSAVTGRIRTPVLKIPSPYTYYCLAVGAVFCIWFLAWRLVRLFRGATLKELNLAYDAEEAAFEAKLLQQSMLDEEDRGEERP